MFDTLNDEPKCKSSKQLFRVSVQLLLLREDIEPVPHPLVSSVSHQHTFFAFLTFSLPSPPKRCEFEVVLAAGLRQRVETESSVRWKVRHAASGGEKASDLPSYLWFCSCILTTVS